MSNKQDISALCRLEFYKIQKAWCFSRQNMAANGGGKTQFYSKNCDATKRPTKDVLIDTVKFRKSKDSNRNCVTNQFQTKSRKLCDKQTRLACIFQYEMRSKKSIDVVDCGALNDFDGKPRNDTHFRFNDEATSVFSTKNCSNSLNQTYSISEIPTRDMTFQTDPFFSQPHVLDNHNNAFWSTSYCRDVEMLDDVQFEESNLTFDEFSPAAECLNISQCVASSFISRRSKMDAYLDTSVSENGFMDGVSEAAHSSALDLANFGLVEGINDFINMQKAPYNEDAAAFQHCNNQLKEHSDWNCDSLANPETMSYADLIKEISQEQLHIRHHSQRKHSLIQAVCQKVVMDSGYDSSPPKDLISNILQPPRGRGRIRNMTPTPGLAGDCSVGIGRGCPRRF